MTPLAALATYDPDAAEAKILNALQRSKGNRPKAAEALKVTVRTLYRLMGKLEITGAEAPEINPKATELTEKAALAAYKKHGNLRDTAKALGVSPSTVWNRLPE